MTKNQALALMGALEARQVPADCLLRYDQGGTEQWSVQLDTEHAYSGADLIALGNYCATNNLVLSAQFKQLGVV